MSASDIDTTVTFSTVCPICDEVREFSCADDFWHCRDGMSSAGCELWGCVTRERALAAALFSLVDRNAIRKMSIHEPAPVMRGLSLWLSQNCEGYQRSGYFPDAPFGRIIEGIRNEDLEQQTFDNASFDIVLHLDVMEHLFQPFKALAEIHRTLKPGGFCVFTAPTEPQRFESEQVAFMEQGQLRVVGEPEFHGNPQRPEDGAIVTWRYGFNLPLLIQRSTGFDVETRRYQTRDAAAMGYMNEVYILRKPR